MYKQLFYINIGVFIFVWARADLASSPDEELVTTIRMKWDECCENNVCINNSCYIPLRRPSSWAAIRQRCQAQFPEWPSSIDIFQIQQEDDLQAISDLILETFNDTFDDEFNSKTVWTSGVKCLKSIPKGPPIYFMKWVSTDAPFPEWLEDKIFESEDMPSKSKDSCTFLVFTPATDSTEIEYEFKDQLSHHAGICEFILPEDLPIIIPSETTLYETTSTSETVDLDATTLTETEKPTTLATVVTIKSNTLGPSEKFSTLSTEKKQETITTTTTVITTFRTTAELRTTKLTTTSTTTEPTETIRFCKGKQVAGIKWPDTMSGITVNESCPEGMTGYAQWTCNESTLQFTPEKPHIQECKHIWITELEDKVNNGNDAVDISSNLARETKDKEMSHGDITALVDLSVKILHLFSMQNEDENSMEVEDEPKQYVFTGSMVSSMSNILRAEIKDAWEILPASHQTRAASKILQLVTIIGSHLSCIKKSEEKLQFTVAAENINLQTFILNKEKQDENNPIVFPQKVDGVKINSTLIVPANLMWERPFSTCKKYNTAVGVLYKHVGDFLKDENLLDSHMKVVTKVISFSMNNNTDSVVLPKGKWVMIILRHSLQGDFQHQHLRCMFWNFSKQTYGQWDDSGCYRISSNNTHIVCSCNHLTNFAVLMDVNNNVEEDKILSMMTYVCCGMSCFCLVITLICFLSIRSLHGRRSIITGNLCFSLLVTNLLILFGLDRAGNKIICATIAGFLHFWILSAFCWMLVEGYHLYKMVVLVFERGHGLSVKFYYLFAYGIPLIIVGISAGIRPKDYGGEIYCWLSSNNGLMWSFVGPACAIILVNIVVFVLTIRSASSVRIKREQTTVKKIKNWARGSMSVMCLLGLTWCLGLFYIDKNLRVFSYIFTVLNGLQGVFIFFFHILLNDKVTGLLYCKGNKKEMWRKFLPQTSSKLSARTSLNSCGAPVHNPTGLTNVTSHQISSSKSSNASKQKLRSRRNWNVQNKTNYKKERATHTLSENGLTNAPVPRRFKTRSQSYPDDRDSTLFHQNISYITRN